MLSTRDLSRHDCIKEFIKRKWSSGLLWAVGAAEKKNPNCHKYATFWGGFLMFSRSKNNSKIFLKITYTIAVGSYFFSATPTAQNSPELHFRFINSFIQLSRVGSLFVMMFFSLFEKGSCMSNKYLDSNPHVFCHLSLAANSLGWVWVLFEKRVTMCFNSFLKSHLCSL